MGNTAINASRVLMGDSLGFHIIFVLFGLTLPILVSWFELMGIIKKDATYTETAKLWSKIAALLVIAGVISGTVVALQMTLVWPGILKFGGSVIGLPFMYETYAFLIEAVFLGLYLGTWANKKVSPMLHWLFGLGVVVGAIGSAFAITSVNAWMNYPTGFDLVGGKLVNVDVIGAMFSLTSVIEFIHSMPAYFLTAALAIAGLYGLKMLRKNRPAAATKADALIIKKLMIFSAIFLVLTVIAADTTGKYLAKKEPIKLATLEALHHTTSNAPLVLGGGLDVNGNLTGPRIEVPGLLSWLSGGSTSTVVTGLEATPQNLQPPSYLHLLFTIKMLLVGFVSAMLVGYFVLLKWRAKWLTNKVWLIALGLAGLSCLVIVELGWMLTEIGRQPWAVTGYVTTEQALTKANDITTFGYIFPLAYVLLMSVTVMGIIKIVRDNSPRKTRSAS
jgi:cytochrome d ubiquinol oxidase subunit I